MGPETAKTAIPLPPKNKLGRSRKITEATRPRADPPLFASCRIHGVLLVTSFLVLSVAFTACDNHNISKSTNPAPVLLFNGTGTSANDVAAIETILNQHHLNYATVNSAQLNDIGESQLRGYRLLIVPGGNFINMGNSLASNTSTNIRNAVHDGLNYFGICAGAIIAGNPRSNGLNLADGVRFGFYAVVNQGIHKTTAPIAVAGGPTLDQYWEDGPQLAGWGMVVGKYPDGTPAIVQGTFGNGCVILTGVHPEAPASWRRGMTFHTSASEDHDYAWTLIDAALNRTSLPHY